MVDDGWRNETGIKRITKLYTLQSNSSAINEITTRVFDDVYCHLPRPASDHQHARA
jgi:hypothetical protein